MFENNYRFMYYIFLFYYTPNPWINRNPVPSFFIQISFIPLTSDYNWTLYNLASWHQSPRKGIYLMLPKHDLTNKQKTIAGQPRA